MRKAAVSFTGGKDCVLALHIASSAFKPAGFTNDAAGSVNHLNVQVLVTFAPKGNANFKAHPLPVIQAQAAALGLPHILCEVEAPYLECYRDNIHKLRATHGIDVLITGDILDVCNGFMSKAAEGTGVELLCPLWQLPRSAILDHLWQLHISPIISCINLDKLKTTSEEHSIHTIANSTDNETAAEAEQQAEEADLSVSISTAMSSDDASTSKASHDCTQQCRSPVDDLLGRQLDAALLQEGPLQHYITRCGIDAAGEGGEYHTLVLDAPLFTKRVQLQWRPRVEGPYAYLDISSIELVDKAAGC